MQIIRITKSLIYTNRDRLDFIDHVNYANDLVVLQTIKIQGVPEIILEP